MKYMRAAFWCLCVVSFAFARESRLAFPISESIDTEATTNLVQTFKMNSSGKLDLILDFECSLSNNVEIALGVDVDLDDSLSLAEEELSLGWDCGSWFVLGGKDEALLQEVESSIGQQKFVYHINVNRVGAVRQLAISNLTHQVFTTLSETKPVWAYNPNWNLMRLTARGFHNPTNQFTVKLIKAGLVIRIK